MEEFRARMTIRAAELPSCITNAAIKFLKSEYDIELPLKRYEFYYEKLLM
jgi:hypothetical protein